MRLNFFLLIHCLLVSTSHFCQNLSNHDKYYQIGLIWGLLKYHHPELSNGKINLDREFLKLIEQTEAIQSQEELNTYLLQYINSQKNSKIKIAKNTEANFFKNDNYQWINKDIFGDDLFKKLLEISNNQNVENYYVKTSSLNKMLVFSNEKEFPHFDYKNSKHRLLLLVKFWNIINYWNVNKYLIDEDWSKILKKMIPQSTAIKTKLEFELFKSKLIAQIQDSHSFYCSPIVNDTLYKYKPFFTVKNVNDTLIVNSIYNKQLALINNIELGDLITSIDDKPIAVNLNSKLKPIISTSNSTFLKKWSTFLFYSPKDSIKIEILKRKSDKQNRYIKLYTNLKQDDPLFFKSKYTQDRFFIKNDIYYLNLLNVNSRELKDIFEEIKSSKVLILDLRNYPKNLKTGDLANYLYDKKKTFIKVLFPIEKAPSKGIYNGKAPLDYLINPFEAGTNNNNYYKGKVILLVNKNTQSWAEYLGMEIQASNNCLTVGEQTAGSVMNIVSFLLSDGTIVNFSGLGAYYPDDNPVQKNGLKIDKIIHESALNYNPDDYLNETLKIIYKLYGI